MTSAGAAANLQAAVEGDPAMLRISAFVLAALICAAAMWWLSRDLAPPGEVRFAAGAEGGGYWRIAEQYRDILAEDGIELELIATAGSVENAQLLARGDAEAGLLQGGIETGADIETLGAVFTEPLLVFARTGGDEDGGESGGNGRGVAANPALWEGLTIAAGADGSGARAAMQALLAAADTSESANTLLTAGGEDAAAALSSGEADIALFVAPLSAPYLEPVLVDPQIELVRFDHLVALSRRMPPSLLVEVPSGAFSLDPPLPAQELTVLGLAARIAAQPDIHPAVVDRLVEAARQVHAPGDILTEEGRYPTMDNTSLPQNAYARDLIADGPSALNAVLPYWVTAQISRFAILLLPVVFLLLPAMRALPGVYKWGIRRQVFRHYSRIREIDEEAARTDDEDELLRLDKELAEIDRQIAHLKLPLSHRDYAYTARMHIDLLRKKIADGAS